MKNKIYYLTSIAIILFIMYKLLINSFIMDTHFLSLEENEKHLVVKYSVTNGIAEYWINKKPKLSEDKNFVQFIEMIKYNDIPVTKIPYLNGLSGLVLYSDISEWDGKVLNNNDMIEISFTDSNDIFNIKLSFSAQLPLLKISSSYNEENTNITNNESKIFPAKANEPFRYTFWQAIGGESNLNNRVVVPRGEKQYYVINGNANGIHYFPLDEFWSLRMGAENTKFQNVTIGFMVKDHTNIRLLNENEWKPSTWGPWAMGQDLYLDNDNQFKSEFDKIPYELEKVKGNIYANYQEDEAGLGYAWIDFASPKPEANNSIMHHNEVYFWVGEDHWKGNYGLNNEESYRFKIDTLQEYIKNK